MNDKNPKQWAFIFHQFGRENLRKMLFKAAIRKQDEGRVVVEFDGEKAMDVTEHVEELEADL
jgi:hypothetical protein